MIPNLKHLPYKKRLEHQIYRRRRGDMIMCFKIITNKLNINMDNFFMFNQRSTRGHEFKLRKAQRFTKQPRCQNFTIRSIDDWDSLPSEVIRGKSIKELKKTYWTNIKRIEDLNPPLQCNRRD